MALTVDGIDIPIVVLTPEQGKGPFPVVYHVHGGGWNGGTKMEVPGAGLPPESKVLCDELGIVYVGLAYRGKAQGTFQDAMDDLRASIKWFESNKKRFNADTSRVGFSGGSAGTPLSALLAQEMSSCKTYVGLFGVYNLLSNEESLFPDEEACAEYDLVSEQQKRAASAFYHIRKNPPATLLFHGALDILVHPTQSERFAEKLKAAGAEVSCTIYPNANHGYLNPRNPEEYKDSVLKIADLYTQHLTRYSLDVDGLSAQLDEMLERYFPLEKVNLAEVVGRWKAKKETLEFSADGTGTSTNQKGESRPLTYTVNADRIDVSIGQNKMVYYMQNDRRAIYSIYPEGRFAGRKEHYTRQK
ncbi:alpha/beta hydrolase [Pontiella sulfatireligans]|uniref:alpha/beta hydrolase n=1 Tax=Pontiella sulfatireligans TaxID=2750658 RepID=UPI00144391BD|nr:alpha/beta hydrolase [Pontiella sulfatireligans]